MINLSIHGVTSVEITEPEEFEVHGSSVWESSVIVRRGDDRQALRLFTHDGPDALRVNDDALDAKCREDVVREQTERADGYERIAKRWQNVALGQTRRGDALQRELDDLRADLAGLSRRMAE